MDNLLPNIRNSVRALIVRDGSILMLHKDAGDQREAFALPGGAQDPGETLEQALYRECLEEIGTPVQVCELVRVADSFKEKKTVPAATAHLVEFLFRCTVPDDYTPCNGCRPDKRQKGVVWVPVSELSSRCFYSRSLAPLLDGLPSQKNQSVYLGLIG
ncbi:MAG: NUDIX domain-containing protein [Gammaproteobacteria bacterium]|nr:NUDIX domain-containing protein [Gammaproteobacteria bacterium]